MPYRVIGKDHKPNYRENTCFVFKRVPDYTSA